MAFRIGRKHAAHTYPETRQVTTAPPLVSTGINGVGVTLPANTETQVASTAVIDGGDGPLLLNGQSVFIAVSFQFNMSGGG